MNPSKLRDVEGTFGDFGNVPERGSNVLVILDLVVRDDIDRMDDLGDFTKSTESR